MSNTPLVRIVSSPLLHKSLPEITSAISLLKHHAVEREACMTEHLTPWLRSKSGELHFSIFKRYYLHCKVMKIQ